jgi:hypothetical protein
MLSNRIGLTRKMSLAAAGEGCDLYSEQDETMVSEHAM